MNSPLSNNMLYLTDSGLETTLLFLDGWDLPAFAAFPLYENATGRARLDRYYRDHLAMAEARGFGFVFEVATWRANPDWAASIGYGADDLARINRDAVRFCRAIADEHPVVPTLVSGQIGPRGDGYVADTAMTPDEAERYHAPQIEAFADAGADLATALTMTNVEEAVGIVRAAQKAGIASVISFTMETDGRLPTGEALGDAIARTDAETGGAAAYFMINCCHPEHFAGALDERVADRVMGLRANASKASHAELDAATELDAGDPEALARDYAALRERLPNLRVFGGCCGTDLRHIGEIAGAVAPAERVAG